MEYQNQERTNLIIAIKKKKKTLKKCEPEKELWYIKLTPNFFTDIILSLYIYILYASHL